MDEDKLRKNKGWRRAMKSKACKRGFGKAQDEAKENQIK